MTSYTHRLRIAECAMLIALSITLCLALWGQANQTALANELIRLHVIAQSDDDYEQELKLKVRDAVLSYTAPLLDGAEDVETACEILTSNLRGIQNVAAAAAQGRQVEVTLTQESYPTRHYGSFALPAGKYLSLRILLGQAQGQNWWCVIFPPLCNAAYSETAAEAMGENSAKLVFRDSAPYVLRFRCAELWGELRNALEKGF